MSHVSHAVRRTEGTCAGRTAPARRIRRQRRRHVPARAVALLAVVAILGALAVVLGAAGRTPGRGEPAESTPRSEWRLGEVPSLYQTDPAWAQEPYAGGTIEKNGCGPTCLAMVYVALTGSTDMGPVEMAGFSESGGYVTDGMTAWSLMTDGASRLGLASRELPADEGSVRSELEAGHPVVCSVRPGDFTTTGHFIVLAGIADDGGVVVRDPNSAENSSHAWDLARVLDQCANLWSFSA